MKLNSDQYKKSLLKPCQVDQQAFLRRAAPEVPALSNSTGWHFWNEHLIPAYLDAQQLMDEPPCFTHNLGTKLRDLRANFPFLTGPGIEGT